MIDRYTDERGFAIPVTVFIITLLTVMLASGFARTRADRQVAEGTELTTEALSIARGGMHQYMAAETVRPANGFVDTMYVTGGFAIVTGSVVQNPADTLASQTWILQSTGYVIDAATGNVPRAQRTVAQFAQWQSGAINPRGALTAPNGIQFRNRGIAIINGDDLCNVEPDVPGIRTAGTSGSAPVLILGGTPGILDEGGSAGPSMAADTYIDWQDVLNGVILPDYTSMPTSFSGAYPVIVVEGDLTTSDINGDGMLIVTGDLETHGYFLWSGIILVGGDLDFDGYQHFVYGLVVSGLAEDVGLNPGRTEVGTSGGPFTSYFLYVRYSSCSVLAALNGLTGFAPIENAWVDNWATY